MNCETDKGNSAQSLVELLKEVDNWMINAVDILSFVESHYHGEMSEEASLLKWHEGKLRDRILQEINAEAGRIAGQKEDV